MYCEIHTTGDVMTSDWLREKLVQIFGSPFIEGYIELPHYSIYIDDNEAYDLNKQHQFPDGFIYFEFIIELDFYDSCQLSERISTTNKLLDFLWKAGHPAVAVCDYEDDLMLKGGYKDASIPWPGR